MTKENDLKETLVIPKEFRKKLGDLEKDYGVVIETLKNEIAALKKENLELKESTKEMEIDADWLQTNGKGTNIILKDFDGLIVFKTKD